MTRLLALQVRSVALTVIWNTLALTGWTGTGYAVAVLGYYVTGHTSYPPVLPFAIGAAVVMATLGGFIRARDYLPQQDRPDGSVVRPS